jgi:hypothetical protein
VTPSCNNVRGKNGTSTGGRLTRRGAILLALAAIALTIRTYQARGEPSVSKAPQAAACSGACGPVLPHALGQRALRHMPGFSLYLPSRVRVNDGIVGCASLEQEA